MRRCLDQMMSTRVDQWTCTRLLVARLEDRRSQLLAILVEQSLASLGLDKGMDLPGY